jgi:hypothetical protein
MKFEDIARTREATERHLANALQPGDRVGIFTSSGQHTLDFTDDRETLGEIIRSFRIGESKRWLDFRVESNNFTNTASFTGLAAVVNSRNYGLATSAGAMRTLSATTRVRF